MKIHFSLKSNSSACPPNAATLAECLALSPDCGLSHNGFAKPPQFDHCRHNHQDDRLIHRYALLNLCNDEDVSLCAWQLSRMGISQDAVVSANRRRRGWSLHPLAPLHISFGCLFFDVSIASAFISLTDRSIAASCQRRHESWTVYQEGEFFLLWRRPLISLGWLHRIL